MIDGEYIEERAHREYKDEDDGLQSKEGCGLLWRVKLGMIMESEVGDDYGDYGG